jgi:hypothetical protein
MNLNNLYEMNPIRQKCKIIFFFSILKDEEILSNFLYFFFVGWGRGVSNNNKSIFFF